MGKIFSQLISAQLENRTSDYSSGTRGRIWMRTDTSPVVAKFDDGSAIRTLVTTDNTQTLTNKTLTSPAVTGLTGTISSSTDIDLGTASNTSRITVAKNTLANLTALTRKEGTVWYATDTDKLYKDDGTSLTEIGSGSGGSINYIGNPDAESGVTGWAAYADAAATSPVDGTGGSPTVTITRTTTTPLRGTGSFLITKDAANRQGEGVGYAFTIDSADKAKILNISFDYEIASGTFTSGDSSDIRVWVYDVTNAVLIPVSPATIQGGSSLQWKFTGTFQTASNSTSYRLILHCATTSASAYTFEFDNVVVGPQVVNYGAPIGDWTSFTPTITNVSTSSTSAYYRRVGDSMEVSVYAVLNNTVSGVVSVTIPASKTIDSSKISTSHKAIGTAMAGDASANDILSLVIINDSTTVKMEYNDAASSVWNTTVPFTWVSTDTMSIFFKVPITGWSSTVLMSNDTDTRVVAARVTGDAASASSGDPVIFPTASYDTHSSYNVSTGFYTVPVSGYYRVHGLIISANAAVALNIAVNGTAVIQAGLTDASGDCAYTGTVSVTAGQTISLEPGGTLDASSASTMHIERISGPSAIAASETIAALYESNSATSIASGSATIVNFEDTVFDTHGAVTVGASWKFTAPSPGKYRVNSFVELASNAGWEANESMSVQLFKNGSIERNLGTKICETTMAGGFIASVGGSTLVSLNAGDYIDIRISQNSDGAINTGTDPDYVWVSVERI